MLSLRHQLEALNDPTRFAETARIDFPTGCVMIYRTTTFEDACEVVRECQSR